jgi:hypothetical protein
LKPNALGSICKTNFVTFEPDKIEVFLDDRKLVLETGQGVKEHEID